MFNNSENRFSKYSFEMAENRKKRKLSSSAHQPYSFPFYEGDKDEKENFSQVSNSHQVRIQLIILFLIYILKLLY